MAQSSSNLHIVSHLRLAAPNKSLLDNICNVIVKCNRTYIIMEQVSTDYEHAFIKDTGWIQICMKSWTSSNCIRLGVRHLYMVAGI